MSISRALASFATCAADHQFRNDHLKLCILWYDEILFQDLGQFDKDRFLTNVLGSEKNARSIIKDLSDVVIPLSARIGSDTLNDIRESMLSGYPRWGEKHENYTYPEPETPEEYAHNRLLAQIESEFGVARFSNGMEIEQAEGRAKVAVDAVTLWNTVNREIPCMLQANRDEKLAMTAVEQFAAKAEETPSPFRLFEMAIPSLSNVPWNQIVELRRNGAMGTLRTKMAEAVERVGANLDAAKQAFEDIEKNAMDDILELARPRPRKVAIEALLANIPGLPVNPASLYFGARDTLSAIKRSNAAGWLYLLRDIRNAADIE
jgi:hypothetical protein